MGNEKKEYAIGEVFRHTDGKSISAWKMLASLCVVLTSTKPCSGTPYPLNGIGPQLKNKRE